MTIEIASEVLTMVVRETAREPDREVCGLLFGTADAITAAQPCRNVAENPHDSFEIDPAALIASHRAVRAGGPGVIGCYHSHPNGSPLPSPRDAAAAAPDGWVWLIVAEREIRAYRAAENGFHHRKFAPLDF